jgi:sulfopyruvate decarboxylase TPP-binding subunit
MLVTMRGEWSEFNPWQVPMSRATQPSLEAIGVRVYRADAMGEVAETVAAAAEFAFDGEQQVAVLLSQRMLGKKIW